MAGGTWAHQNKVRPGVYINFKAKKKAAGALGERGVVVLPLTLSWGKEKAVTALETGDNVLEALGYPLTHPSLLLLREAQKQASKVLVYRLNDGVKAAVTVEGLTVTARHGGVRGNDLSVVITVNGERFDVATLLEDEVQEVQTVAVIAELRPNAWVTFSGTGDLAASAGAPLTGGTDTALQATAYADMLAAIETLKFNTLAIPTTETSDKVKVVEFVRRMREEEGRPIQAVLENYPIADYEGILSVKNGVQLADGTVLTAAQATAWVAAATAAAGPTESLTYHQYEGAVAPVPVLTHTAIVNALKAGEIVFSESDGRVVVEQDINTLVTYDENKSRVWAKNRCLRVLDSIGADVKLIGERQFIGKVSNNPDGRDLLKGAIIGYLTGLQNIGAIQNFDAQADVTVAAGMDIDAVLVGIAVQPVDAIEKIYIEVEVA